MHNQYPSITLPQLILSLFILFHLTICSEHICNTASSCQNENIQCSENEDCYIECSATSACRSASIQCPSNHSCTVSCTNNTAVDQCRLITINGTYSSLLTINVTATAVNPKSMWDAFIYCPSNGPGPYNISNIACRITCIGDDIMQETEIFAVEGSNDFVILAQSFDKSFCYRRGVLHCTEHYNHSCDLGVDGNVNITAKRDCKDTAIDQTCTRYTLATPSPTVSPTLIPTNEPTLEPTLEPIDIPTQTPSNSPTSPPTATPTQTPTVEPTFEPSIEPTNIPTNLPTFEPIIEPSSQPTNEPTNFPTITQTQSPSDSPIIPPTNAPTLPPSISPTISPIKPPTISPTIAPSFPPTNSPLIVPTDDPTNFPTNIPTLAPLITPSLSPTNAPIIVFVNVSVASSTTTAATTTESEQNTTFVFNTTSSEASSEETSTTSTDGAHNLDSNEVESVDRQPLGVYLAIVIIGLFACLFFISVMLLYRKYHTDKAHDYAATNNGNEGSHTTESHDSDDACSDESIGLAPMKTVPNQAMIDKYEKQQELHRMKTKDVAYAKQIIAEKEESDQQKRKEMRKTTDQSSAFSEHLSQFAEKHNHLIQDHIITVMDNGDDPMSLTRTVDDDDDGDDGDDSDDYAQSNHRTLTPKKLQNIFNRKRSKSGKNVSGKPIFKKVPSVSENINNNYNSNNMNNNDSGQVTPLPVPLYENNNNNDDDDDDAFGGNNVDNRYEL